MNKENEAPVKLNLLQKLLEIQRSISGLGKDSSSGTGNFGYKYVSGSKVLDHVKPLMNKYGLLLKQEVVNIENSRQDYTTKNGSKSEILTKAEMLFTWIDCETNEREVCRFFANGQNDWEKGLGSALTYAERYFLLKFFHINTDEDDIDNPTRKTSDPVQQKQEPTEYLIPGFEPDVISVQLYNQIQKIQHKDIILANEILKTIKNEIPSIKKYFNVVCLSKAMKYNADKAMYEVLEPTITQ